MKNWIHAARLRTLPLSISGILLGSLIALSEGYWNWAIFSLAFLTTLFLQVLSNYANDYGDGIRGTDAERIGERRVVASGDISPKQMKNAIVLFPMYNADRMVKIKACIKPTNISIKPIKIANTTEPPATACALNTKGKHNKDNTKMCPAVMLAKRRIINAIGLVNTPTTSIGIKNIFIGIDIPGIQKMCFQ